jgi:hypothetical protein
MFREGQNSTKSVSKDKHRAFAVDESRLHDSVMAVAETAKHFVKKHDGALVGLGWGAILLGTGVFSGYAHDHHEEHKANTRTSESRAAQRDGFGGMSFPEKPNSMPSIRLGSCVLTLSENPTVIIADDPNPLRELNPFYANTDVADVRDYTIALPKLPRILKVVQNADQLRTEIPDYRDC